VNKELMMYALDDNSVRLVMVTAARRRKVAVARIGFVDALRWLVAARAGASLPKLVVNPDRPDRVEPRVVKRRPKQYPRMTQPRCVLRNALMEQEVAA